MLSELVLGSLVAVLAMTVPAKAAPQQMPKRDMVELSKTAQLRLADSGAQRYKLLPNDTDFVFDFNKTEIPVASPFNFPALTGSGASFSLTHLDGCNMAFLHLHPRASELFAVTSGRVLTEMVPEAGVVTADGKPRVIRTDLSAGMLTIFPAGSFHTQVNPDCERADVVALFTSEDFGAGGVAEQTFALSDDVVSRTFGESIAGEDIDKIRHAIPTTISIKVDECLKKCNKTKRAV